MKIAHNRKSGSGVGFLQMGKTGDISGKKFPPERGAEAQKGLDFLPVYGMMEAEN